MKLETSLHPQLQQKLKLAPQIIQSIEILQLPLLALVEHVQMELEENPVLEELPLAEKPAADEPKDTETEEDKEPTETLSGGGSATGDEWQDFSRYRSKAVRREDSDLKQQALENTASKPISLHEYLLGQFSLMEVAEELREVCELILSYMDDRGYLTVPLEEIVTGAPLPVSLETAQQALQVIQTMEPPGVGARNLEECLLLQLDNRLEDYAFLKELITHHLKDIEMKRYPQVAKGMNRDTETIKRAVDYISTLNPRPGSLFLTEPVAYVVPDVRVEYVDGRYEVILNENSALPRLAISSFYREHLHQKGLDATTHQFLQKKMESARWLIEAIEQRRATLYKVTNKMVELQKNFLEEGIAGLRPLRMQEVADQLGIHVSTVSRAISRKYIQTPRGVFEMKFFFTGGFETAQGDVESWPAMRQKLTEIVAKEDKSHPLSDEDLAAVLRSQGIDIARRTVTKYRKAIKIPSSRRRRQY
ncbi:MAG TPA: RNA polymerase factor sigma-54 [Candidatus Tripitaka californicus]|uniref:RNA polymerase factor sigma-54 n=1 Tax=Candidatus Tripitaka californicus TaxID=3367616 RepID=UPI0040256F1B